jgi:predicted nucleotidyltransferase
MDRVKLQEALREYREGLKAELGEQLECVILYGSHAREDTHEGSDIDVLCVLREPFDLGEMIRRTSELTARLSLQHDVALSRTFVTREDYENRQLPFMMNVRREGVLV